MRSTSQPPHRSPTWTFAALLAAGAWFRTAATICPGTRTGMTLPASAFPLLTPQAGTGPNRSGEMR
ncbi:MAG: hypothetical protein IT198_07715 [Acidimicrobiia bacterium]|nr:hypothetical protein [Acidimicrobiia bacterium]